MRNAVPMWPLLVALAACTPEATVPPAEVPPVASSTAPPVDTSATAPPAKATTTTLFVRETRADCEGEGPQKCLQVRSSPSEAWTLHYGAIEGFHYEEGHAYELHVTTETVGHPPADGSSKKVKLVEIVSKTKVP